MKIFIDKKLYHTYNTVKELCYLNNTVITQFPKTKEAGRCEEHR